MLFSVFEDLGACNSMNLILCDHRELSHDRSSHRCFDLLRLSELGQKWVLMNMDVPVLYESLMPKCSNSLCCFPRTVSLNDSCCLNCLRYQAWATQGNRKEAMSFTSTLKERCTLMSRTGMWKLFECLKCCKH